MSETLHTSLPPGTSYIPIASETAGTPNHRANSILSRCLSNLSNQQFFFLFFLILITANGPCDPLSCTTSEICVDFTTSVGDGHRCIPIGR